MASFIHSILSPNQLIAADGDLSYDLPVNPLSAVLLHIAPLNECTDLDTYSFIGGLLSALDNVRITHKGSAVVDACGYDLAILALVYHKLGLWQSGAENDDGFRRSLVVPVLFGRNCYMPTECFPETKKGELIMTCTWDIADTAFDGLRVSIETIELPEAAPEFVQKVTTLAQTFAAVGQNDVDLPIGNIIRALLLWGTTSYTGAAPAPTWGQLEVLKDNRQHGYTSTDWEVSRCIMGLTGVPYPPTFTHIHDLDSVAAAEQDVREPQVQLTKEEYYTLLQFDPLRDDLYSLETAGSGRVNVRCDAEAANAVRVLPIEKVPVGVFLD